MKIKCECGRYLTVFDRLDDDNDDVAHNIELALSAIRGHQTRLSALEKQAEQVTPIEDLVERHRRLVEYVLKHIGDVALIDEDVVVETRAKLNVGG